MNKKKCEVCGSSHTVKNGVRKGVQLYKCQECGYQFRAGTETSEEDLWNAYQQEKQTPNRREFCVKTRPDLRQNAPSICVKSAPRFASNREKAKT